MIYSQISICSITQHAFRLDHDVLDLRSDVPRRDAHAKCKIPGLVLYLSISKKCQIPTVLKRRVSYYCFRGFKSRRILHIYLYACCYGGSCLVDHARTARETKGQISKAGGSCSFYRGLTAYEPGYLSDHPGTLAVVTVWWSNRVGTLYRNFCKQLTYKYTNTVT